MPSESVGALRPLGVLVDGNSGCHAGMDSRPLSHREWVGCSGSVEELCGWSE